MHLFTYFSPTRIAIFGGVILKTIINLIATRVVLKLSNFFVEKFFKTPSLKGFNYNPNPKRVQTLKYLTLSIVRYTVYFFAGTMILESFGFPISSILAGAGVVGLAIGFGAQNLVHDVITGFFILFENQFSVGDHVQIGEIEGIVEEIGLRILKIKSFAGQIHVIPNGKISIVTNFQATSSIRIMFDVGVAYEEDVDHVIAVLERVCEEFYRENDKIVEAPKVLGVQSLDDYAVSIRIISYVVPMEQWGVERELKRKIKKVFDKEGIEIPYPKQVLYMARN